MRIQRAPQRVAALGAAILLISACSRPESPAPKPDNRPVLARDIPQPRITDQDVATYVAGSRREEEAAAIARILSRQQSPAARESMRQKLADHHIVFHSASDPVVADDLAVVQQIRFLDGMAVQRDDFRIAARQTGATLLLGLSTTDVVGSAGALIVRPRAAFKQNIVLVTNSTSADQLATAIDDIQALRLQVGDSPFVEQRVVVRQAAPHLQIAPTTRAQYDGYLSDVKQAPIGTMPGFGPMRMVHVRLPPVG